jgi:hypothetical protein
MRAREYRSIKQMRHGATCVMVHRLGEKRPDLPHLVRARRPSFYRRERARRTLAKCRHLSSTGLHPKFLISFDYFHFGGGADAFNCFIRTHRRSPAIASEWPGRHEARR